MSAGAAGVPPRADRADLQDPRYRSLFWRIFLTNAVILALACALAVVVLPGGVFSLDVAARELVIFAAAAIIMVVANLALTRRILQPIERLVELMRRFDPLRPGDRVVVDSGPSEASELAGVFNEMLERIETGRAESIRRALEAQESERLRVAQEIHDEIGQNLTAALLQLGRARRLASPAVREELNAAVEIVRENLDELRRIAQRLRPQALEELGLTSALGQFAARLDEGSDLEIEQRLDRALPPLSYEQELVIYRVSQEALTNVVRHAGATRATLAVESAEEQLTLRVLDDGRGVGRGDGGEAGGILGMRERAALIDAYFSIGRRPAGGTEVVMELPLPRSGGGKR